MRAVEYPVQLRRGRLDEVRLLRRAHLCHIRAEGRAVRQGVGQNGHAAEHRSPCGGVGLVDGEQPGGGGGVGRGGEELQQPPVVRRMGGVQPKQRRRQKRMRAGAVFLKVDEAVAVGIEVGVLFLWVQPVKSLPIIGHAVPVAVEAFHQVVHAVAAGPRPPVCQRGHAGFEIHRLPRRATMHAAQPADAGEFVAGELPRVAVHDERVLGVKVVGVDIG